MTIQGAIAELQNLLEADDLPSYYKGGIEKVIETIQMELADRKTENSSEKPNNCDDEPQTDDLFTDKYGDVWEWRGDAWYCISGEDEPQTDNFVEEMAKIAWCNSCKHLADEDCNCELLFTGYEPKDDPQTDCPWK